MKQLMFSAAALAFLGGGVAEAATTLTVTATPDATSTTTVVATRSAASGFSTVTSSPSASNVAVAKFDTTTGVLVGATVSVNTAVSTTAQVGATVPASGSGRTAVADVAFTGVVSGAGFSFNSGSLGASRSCSGGNCLNSPANNSNTTPGSIVGSQTISVNDLSAYAGSGFVNFSRTTTDASVKVTTGANATNGVANGSLTFGSADATQNVYRIDYDYLNFAKPSFSGVSTLDALTLDFGTLTQGAAAGSLSFSLFNLAGANSAGLTLDSVQIASGSGFSTNLAVFNNLTAGGSNTYTVGFDPTSVGAFAQSWVLNLSDYAPGGVGGRTYQLALDVQADVEPVLVDGIPEPATWALMIGGFSLVGASLRRKFAPA